MLVTFAELVRNGLASAVGPVREEVVSKQRRQQDEGRVLQRRLGPGCASPRPRVSRDLWKPQGPAQRARRPSFHVDLGRLVAQDATVSAPVSRVFPTVEDYDDDIRLWTRRIQKF